MSDGSIMSIVGRQSIQFWQAVYDCSRCFGQPLGVS